MQGYNCIMVFDKEEEHLLFCKRLWDPYEGKYKEIFNTDDARYGGSGAKDQFNHGEGAESRGDGGGAL